MHINLRNIFILQLIAVFFAIMNLSNIKIEYVANFLPFFDIMIIFYFTILRPQFFAIWFLFLLGIIADSVTGIPLGITSLSYIITVKLFLFFDKKLIIKENFSKILIKFGIFTLAILLLKWLFLSLYYSKFYSFLNPLIQSFITITLYVFMHKFFHFLNKKLLGSDFD